MQKTLKYYKFIAPANLAIKGLPISKENIEAEAKRLQDKDACVERNFLCEQIVFAIDKMTAQLDTTINDIVVGAKYKICYTIGESDKQNVDCYVVDSNGILCLSSTNKYIDGIRLVGDETNNIALYIYANSKDMVNVDNGSLFIVTTLGNYAYDMPKVKLLSIFRK